MLTILKIIYTHLNKIIKKKHISSLLMHLKKILNLKKELFISLNIAFNNLLLIIIIAILVFLNTKFEVSSNSNTPVPGYVLRNKNGVIVDLHKQLEEAERDQQAYIAEHKDECDEE